MRADRAEVRCTSCGRIVAMRERGAISGVCVTCRRCRRVVVVRVTDAGLITVETEAAT